MEENKIIDYKYNLIEELNKLNIDINNVSIDSFIELHKYFKNLNLTDFICNIFINRFIEICKLKNIDIELFIDNNDKYDKRKYLKIKTKEETYLYFAIFFHSDYSDNIYIDIYWCGNNVIEYKNYYFEHNIDMNTMHEGIKFFFECKYFEKKLSNSIKVYLKKKIDIREMKLHKKEYDFEEMDIIANDLAQWFCEKINLK
jgi:hypothetical protein